jgi:hypothetical protein
VLPVRPGHSGPADHSDTVSSPGPLLGRRDVPVRLQASSHHDGCAAVCASDPAAGTLVCHCGSGSVSQLACLTPARFTALSPGPGRTTNVLSFARSKAALRDVTVRRLCCIYTSSCNEGFQTFRIRCPIFPPTNRVIQVLPSCACGCTRSHGSIKCFGMRRFSHSVAP